MNFKIKRQSTDLSRLALFLRWVQFFLLAVGALALSYCAVVLLDRWLFQAYQNWRFERALNNAQTSATSTQQPGTASIPPRRARTARRPWVLALTVLRGLRWGESRLVPSAFRRSSWKA